jgi:hypothetical protein
LAASTQIIFFLKMLKLAKITFLEKNNIVKENKESSNFINYSAFMCSSCPYNIQFLLLGFGSV